MANSRELKELYREFLDKSRFGMKKLRIDYFYHLYNQDFEKTCHHLKEDKKLRDKIETLQNEQKLLKYPRDSELLESKLNSQNQLAEQRNSMIFEKIKDCHPPQLIFDLHGFTVRRAIDYVYEIFDAMKETPQRLFNSSEEIIFITGKGYIPEIKAHWNRGALLRTLKAPNIQAALLENFQDTWQLEKNSGRVAMHFRKRLTYADALEDFLK